MSEGQGEGWKKSTDQRKPFGCAITRYIFPSEQYKLCNNNAQAIARVKLQRMANNHVTVSRFGFDTLSLSLKLLNQRRAMTNNLNRRNPPCVES
ncbi:MAG TPA: hypothetical protein VJ972_02375 [Anaerolineales bacterium]|nr:hypothetical protein [Anaerolineales bacterium]